MTGREIKKGSLAILPFGSNLVSASSSRPRPSVGVKLVVATNGHDAATPFWLKAKANPAPGDVSVRPGEATAVVPFWLLASHPETPAAMDKSSAVLSYRSVTAKVPCASAIEGERSDPNSRREAVPCWRGASSKTKITMQIVIMTNDSDIPAGTRLCVGTSPP